MEGILQEKMLSLAEKAGYKIDPAELMRFLTVQKAATLTDDELKQVSGGRSGPICDAIDQITAPETLVRYRCKQSRKYHNHNITWECFKVSGACFHFCGQRRLQMFGWLG